jgi:diguanylate cyclase (GGDEF)-like protein
MSAPVALPQAASAADALTAVSRLLALATEQPEPRLVHATLVSEAARLLEADGAALVSVAGSGRLLAATPPARDLDPAALALLRGTLARRTRVVPLTAARARDLEPLFQSAPKSALVLPVGGAELLVIAGTGFDTVVGERGELAGAFATAAAAALAQVRRAAEHAREMDRHAALARAAKNLHESLELPVVLSRLCQEAAGIMDADIAVVYRETPGGARAEAAHGCPPEFTGYELEPGHGLAGKVLQSGRPMLTNEYARIADLDENSPFRGFRASLAVPFDWGEGVRGALSLGYRNPHAVEEDDLRVLETFAELAAVACQNASAHAGLAHAARTDGLTGCLNHAALHDALSREIERCARTGAQLSLVLLDLDHFKRVNDEDGHLAGDEILRRAGAALRATTRAYDLAARYGGDEFALVLPDADEAAACAVAARAVAAIEALAAGGATAGVSQWLPGAAATDLISAADGALLAAKRAGARGTVARASAAAPALAPAVRAAAVMAAATTESVDRSHGTDGRSDEPAAAERLRKRTRQLALANHIGARLAAMTDVDEIVDAAVDELHRAFGYHLCAVIRIRDDDRVDAAAVRGADFLRLGARQWSQPRDTGLIGRCLREGRPVLANDVLAEPDYDSTDETAGVRAELTVPLWVSGELWGAINLEENHTDAFDEDDVRLVETVADQVGAALRSAFLYERLDRAYMGTAEALAAALEAKDAYTAHHARSIVEHAEAVGRRLGLDAQQLRDLRYGAVFHDIGKIAVPEAILNKRGPLTPEERREVERHTIVGEQILAPVEFLAGVRKLVRHEHERWDGAGYPDGLAGEQIPLGARIILACDAFHAMTSDRPYRSAMTTEQAIAELRRGAGSQFDPRVVTALLELL